MRRFFYLDEEDEESEITIEYLQNKLPTIEIDKDSRIREYFTISLMEHNLEVSEYLISIQGAEFFHGYSKEILSRCWCSLESAKFAVRYKFSLFEVNKEGENIFLHSFYSSYLNLNFLRYLVENGVDFNGINSRGENAILLLAKRNSLSNSEQLNIFKYLVELGIDFHHQNVRKFNVMLEYFSSNNPKKLSLEIIKYLISLGIIFKYDDKNDNRRGLIFLYALKGGNIEIIKFLFENGVEFDYFDPTNINIIKRNKPLSYLIDHMNYDLFKYIIDNKIDNEFNYYPGKKFYILHYLISRLRERENQNIQKLNDFFQCFRYFKSRGHNVNEIDPISDKTPLLSLGDLIVGDILLLVLKFLLKEGCDLMDYNEDGSILHHLFLKRKFLFPNENSLGIANFIILKSWDYWILNKIQNKFQWKNNFYQCINNIAPILNLTDRDRNPSPFFPKLKF